VGVPEADVIATGGPSGEPGSAPAEVPVASSPIDSARCAGVPPLGPDGSPPPAPPHAPLGEDLEVPGDRPLYWLAGDAGDSRVLVYLHGMCGDVTAADFFREAVRAHGTLVALRGDKHCTSDRFKWRDEPSKMHQRIRKALDVVQARRGGELNLESVVLFGYSQGAERAEKLAERYPKLFPRVVLGGPPMRASPVRLRGVSAVAVLGGELETTENMRAGADALLAAGIRSRFFSIECAYHGWYGTNAEAQMSEVLAWIAAP